MRVSVAVGTTLDPATRKIVSEHFENLSAVASHAPEFTSYRPRVFHRPIVPELLVKRVADEDGHAVSFFLAR
jgi:hypothetical protein